MLSSGETVVAAGRVAFAPTMVAQLPLALLLRSILTGLREVRMNLRPSSKLDTGDNSDKIRKRALPCSSVDASHLNSKRKSSLKFSAVPRPRRALPLLADPQAAPAPLGERLADDRRSHAQQIVRAIAARARQWFSDDQIVAEFFPTYTSSARSARHFKCLGSVLVWSRLHALSVKS